MYMEGISTPRLGIMYSIANKSVEKVALAATNYFIPCTGSTDFAYLCNGKQFYRKRWNPNSNNPTELENTNAAVRSQCPSATLVPHPISGKVSGKCQGLTEIYLTPDGEALLLPEANQILPRPRYMFAQRMTASTQTFDLLLVYCSQNKHTVITLSAIMNNVFERVHKWYNESIYCGGADPLPAKLIVDAFDQGHTLSDIILSLQVTSDSDEEWTPSERDYETEEDEDEDEDEIDIDEMS
jgi:hypothetical protein